MNINENFIEDYIRSITPSNGEYFEKMEEYALENHIPIVEPEVAQLLKVLLKINRPKKILELGTAMGYSANIMAETLKDVELVTIERRKDMIDLAKVHIKHFDNEDRIRIIEGDAEEVLLTLDEKFDFIFLDAAKGQYKYFFDKCIELLNPGGIIVSDNVLFKGMVASDQLVIRRKKTIVKRLREFLLYINNIAGYTSSVIPIGDGVAITYREE